MHLLSAFSLWWLLPIVALSIVISWRFYNKETWLDRKSKSLKILLIGLRSGLFSIIGILFLGLTLETLQFHTERPILVTLIDQSASMLNDHDSSELNKHLLDLQNELQTNFQDRFQLDTYYFGTGLNQKTKGFHDQKTNMEFAFEQLSTKYFNKNIGAVVVVSDGNYNTGANPAYQAEHLPLTPIYSLAVGDTSLKKDQLIKNVAYNELVFLNNEFPIEVDIEAYRFAAKTAVVRVFEDGKLIASQTLQHQNQFQSVQTLVFNHSAKKPGIKEYRIELSPLSGEFSLRNNSKTIYIEVADSRHQILLLSNAPHPDMAAIASALKGNEQHEIVYKTPAQVKGAVKNYDLIIWHEPSNGFDPTLLNEIKLSKIATWFILGSQAEMSSVKQLPLGINLQLRQQLEEVQTYFQDGFSLFEAEQKWLNLLEQFPPLQRRFGEVAILGATDVLLKQRIGQIQKKEPLLTFSDVNQQRVACLLGEGIWRWKLYAYQRTQNHDVFQSFIRQIINYLMVKKEGIGLRIQAPSRLDTDQDFVFNASFYNASLQAITSPKILWEIRSERGQIKKGELQTKGAYYQYNLGKLAPGRYSWKVQTKFNNKIYSKSGKLIVESVQLEQQESAARHSTLRQLAKQSGGKVFPLADYQKLIKDLKVNDNLVALRTERHQFNELNDYLLIFFILLSLLTAEWFLRRFNGAY